MTRELAIVFIFILTVITNSFGDFQDQMRSYHEILYQRSWQHNREESKDVNLRMPGVHPVKVKKDRSWYECVIILSPVMANLV